MQLGAVETLGGGGGGDTSISFFKYPKNRMTQNSSPPKMEQPKIRTSKNDF